MTDTHDFFREANQSQFNMLLNELKRVDEWMVQDFPEVDFKVKVDSHKDAKTLRIELTFMTANEMSPNDRLFKKLEFGWNEQTWNDIRTAPKIAKLSDTLRNDISHTINAWYNKQKEKDAAQRN